MFKISFKIFENDSEEGMELNGADGYFQFEIDNETYGIYIPDFILNIEIILCVGL
ncbi:hypothetical protein [Lysinibacillus sphaericus]|uniref:hypothetical protein n=1 Tax=Lysinibacillus sphaericus TaxID=1421 RepID=UPI000AF0C966|nr:hypothetical protein [Lysinibacillus sphaericus]